MALWIETVVVDGQPGEVVDVFGYSRSELVRPAQRETG